MVNFSLVVATDKNNGIGVAGNLPWKLKGDMKFFRDTTTNTSDPNKINAVIMGRTTWLSIPEKFRPLPGRLNIVLSTNKNFELPNEVKLATSLENALSLANQKNIESCFVIGGGKVYNEAIKNSLCKKLIITEIDSNFNCDTFFPEYKDSFKKIESSLPQNENGISYQFCTYQKIEN